MTRERSGQGGNPPPVVPVNFTLYSRGYCHLCQDLLDALLALRSPGRPFTVDVIDVDADPALVARFDELVPVLFAGESELCHYFLDEQKVLSALHHWPDQPAGQAGR